MTNGRQTDGPLSGVRVLDLATERAELAGRVLADLGADVLKIEPPGGAAARRLRPFAVGNDGERAESLYWAAVALGKRSVVLALDDAAGRARLLDLARDADILIESFDPGAMAAYGLDYGTVREANPALVYVSITPWGQDGPRSLWRASELTLEAAGGLVGMQGDGDRPPVPVGYPQAAFHAGVQAAADAIIALNERERSGLGQHLDVSMQAAIVWTLMNATGYPPNTGGDPPTAGEGRIKGLELVPGFPMPTIWRCKDGWVQTSITLGGLGARTLGNLVRLIEAEGELSPARQGTGWTAWTETIAPGEVAAETLAEACEEMAAYFARRTGEEIAARAVAEKLLVAPIRPVEALLDIVQLRERGYWQERDGRTYPGPAARLSRTPMRLGERAPRLGEHQGDLAGWTRESPGSRVAAQPRRRAFDGLKVADFAWVGVGPLIAKALADHGATVVHVESAARPDVLRLAPPFKDGEPGLDRSQFFANFNSSKLGIALNLGLREGRELARQLADWADVVVESFTPGVANQLGLDYETLSQNRPELVMLSTCLCGQTGPHGNYRGFGTQGAALAGLHGITGWPDRPPAGTWGAYTDFIAPRYGVAALAAAIYERGRSGLGQHVDLSQVEAAIHFVEPLVLDYVVNGRVHGPAGHESDRASPHGVYRTAGAERFVALSVETQEQWRALRRVAPLGGLALDEDAAIEGRMACDAEIDRALEEWLAELDAGEAVARLIAEGVPASVVQRPSDLYSDPQLAHRGFFVTCEHSVMGLTPYDGPVTLFSATPAQLRAAPAVGEHTDEVLRGLLGLQDEQIAEYAAAGVFS